MSAIDNLARVIVGGDERLAMTLLRAGSFDPNVVLNASALSGASTGSTADQIPGPMPALSLALRSGMTDLASELISRGADVSAGGDDAPIFHVRDAQGVRLLSLHGADLNAQTRRVRGIFAAGASALHFHAAQADGVDMVSALLAAGADPNIRTEMGRTPLHAAMNVSEAMVRLLVRGGANLDLPASPDGSATLREEITQRYPQIAAQIDAGALLVATAKDGAEPIGDQAALQTREDDMQSVKREPAPQEDVRGEQVAQDLPAPAMTDFDVGEREPMREPALAEVRPDDVPVVTDFDVAQIPTAQPTLDVPPGRTPSPAPDEAQLARVARRRAQDLGAAREQLGVTPPTGSQVSAEQPNVIEAGAPPAVAAPPGQSTEEQASPSSSLGDGAPLKEATPPTLTPHGYEVPAAVASRYVVREGGFWRLDGKGGVAGQDGEPAFRDSGPSLSTGSDERRVAADMVAIAQAKYWGTLVLKGSEAFRRNAWIEASLAGLASKGFEPQASDLVLLEAARREREALTIKAGQKAPEVTPANEITVGAGATLSNVGSEAPKQGRREQVPVSELRRKAQAMLKEQGVPENLQRVLLGRFEARLKAGLEVGSQVPAGELTDVRQAQAVQAKFAELARQWKSPEPDVARATPTAGGPTLGA